MYKIKCKFPLIDNIEIITKDKELYDFTIRQLNNYIIDHNKEKINCFVNIKSNRMSNFAEDIFLARKLQFKDNQLNFIKKSRVQQIKYNYDFRRGIKITINLKKNVLYYIKKFKSSTYSLNHILFYQTVLYPIFSLYAINYNFFLVHGSLLKIKDKYIVLTGLDGVGKSSLSNELVLEGAKIYADNFVFFNGEKFFGLNMPIRLDLQNPTKGNIIYEDNNLKEVLYNEILNTSVKVDKIFFLTISEKFNISKLDQNIASFNWQFINSGAGEILDANLFILPFLYMNLLHNNQNIYIPEYYHLTIPLGKIDMAVKEIMC